VEEACKKLPVITFDRSVNSHCPVTAIRSIGGYAWGKVGADFIAANVPKGGTVLVLRTAPGVDLFETRWAAAKKVFDAAGLKVVGNEFVGGDRAKTKATVLDYLGRVGKIDAVWVDLGSVSVAVAEAFEDAGQPYPVITGEDEQDYLQAWKKDGFKGIAPTYPAYQWRTAVIAALKILKGEPVPGPDWVLPQPSITAKNLDQYVNPKLPPLHYSMCGCERMPGYPQRWGGKE
jgi:ribose transport system substrate-binding protein